MRGSLQRLDFYADDGLIHTNMSCLARMSS
jgi:hypothetical protein